MDWPSPAELQAIAEAAAHTHWSRLIGFDARVEAAHDGILQAIEDGADGTPYAAALRGISSAVATYRSDYGIPDRRPSRANERTGHRFAVYWAGTATPFTEQVEENLALTQVWPALPEVHQEALRTLAAQGTVSASAAAAGVPYSTMASRIMYARKAARELWNSPDPDPGHYGKSVPAARHDAAYRLRTAQAHRRARRRLALADEGAHYAGLDQSVSL